MSKLEELVPPLALCKLIPKGEFEDGYFVWKVGKPLYNGGKVYIDIGTRSCPLTDIQQIPAPTLQEIMADTTYCRVYKKTSNTFVAVSEPTRVADRNGATAALKLWLKLKGIEYEK